MLELLPHARYIWRTALSDVRHRYAGSGAGVLWNILQPLSMILIYSLVFASIMDRPSRGDAPYVVYLCSAMLPWIAFSDTVGRGSRAILANAQYLRKLPIPESAFVAQAVVSSAIGLAISYAILAVAAIPFGFVPNAYWLLAPVAFVCLLLLGFGVAAIGAAVVPFVQDVSEIIRIVLTIGFWAYPMVYVADILPHKLQVVLPLNPAYPALEAGRQMMLEARLPDAWLLPTALGWGVLFSVLGLWALRAVRAEIRDVI
ncbi:MAG: ABC transporter permease [Phycisphaerales bacterium]|jgi:ABC-type polysaccharide/polyol phosphate export permease